MGLLGVGAVREPPLRASPAILLRSLASPYAEAKGTEIPRCARNDRGTRWHERWCGAARYDRMRGDEHAQKTRVVRCP